MDPPAWRSVTSPTDTIRKFQIYRGPLETRAANTIPHLFVSPMLPEPGVFASFWEWPALILDNLLYREAAFRIK
jgi:hypothetical protein